MSHKMHLTLIMGPMFAGKSSAIISRVRRAEAIGWKTLVVTSAEDNRYENKDVTARIMTHDKAGISAIGLSRLKEILDHPEYSSARLIIIEEAQFFPDLYYLVLQMLEKDGKNLVVVGLDGDSSRRPFGDMIKLVPLADEVQKLTSLCKKCGDGTPALFSCCLRDREGRGQIFVGGPEVYEPMCRKHYLENSLLASK
jgi:thymidine kinase